VTVSEESIKAECNRELEKIEKSSELFKENNPKEYNEIAGNAK